MATRTASFASKRMKDGSRWHVCGACHYEWPDADRWLWWPIRVKSNGTLRRRNRPFAVRRWYWPPTRWGVQLGTDALWRRTFTRVVGIGPVRLIFGYKARLPDREMGACPQCGAAAWIKPGVEKPTIPTVPRWEMWRIELVWRLKYSRESYEAMHRAFENAFRRSETLEEAVRVVTGPVTLSEVRQLVRTREDATARKAAE